MPLIKDREDILANAYRLADAIHDKENGSEEAATLVARGRVFLPVRYGERLVFTPAKFIGYENNSLEEYLRTTRERSGSKARAAITSALGLKAVPNSSFDKQLSNYCDQIGVELRDNRHSFWTLPSTKSFKRRDRSAIHDLDELEIGNPDPEYRRRMAGTYVRDQAVRREVLKRAKGICEFCGEPGFRDRKGREYLETHHIISLSEQGPDLTSNVIAVCPNDHRRAHFGDDWEQMQTDMLSILTRTGS